MTECERIIEKGVIPASFMEEEIRCDFPVDQRRKKIWIVQMDILLEIDRICKKYKIQYFAIAGTMLGAVRHHGMIPWDDDIDISMKRSDYRRFCRVCPKEIRPPYFLQTTCTENDCHCDFARLCNSNTTGIRNSMKKKENVNKGIFVDIIPLDAVPEQPWKRRLYHRRAYVRTVIAAANSLNVNKSPVTRAIHGITNNRLFKMNIRKWDRKTEAFIGSVDWNRTEKVGLVARTPFKHEKVTWDKKDFASVIILPFEMFEIPVPAGYDHILTQMYGNYMEFPPLEQRGKWHDDVIFDPDIPFKDYRR